MKMLYIIMFERVFPLYLKELVLDDIGAFAISLSPYNFERLIPPFKPC